MSAQVLLCMLAALAFQSQCNLASFAEPQQSEDDGVEPSVAAVDLVRQATVIARVRVVEMETIRQRPPLAPERFWVDSDYVLAELAIEDRIYGDLPQLQIPLIGPPSGDEPSVKLVVGRSYIAFLRPEYQLTTWTSEQTRSELSEKTGEADLFEPIALFPLVMTEGRDSLQCKLPFGSKGGGVRGYVEYDVAKERVLIAISEFTPVLKCSYVTTGAFPWYMELSGAGDWGYVGRGGGKGHLSPTRASHVWLAAGACMALEWPESVSEPNQHHVPYLRVELRTPSSVLRTAIFPMPEGGHSGEHMEFLTHMRKLWSVLPGDPPDVTDYFEPR